jgi:hypothetical protein
VHLDLFNQQPVGSSLILKIHLSCRFSLTGPVEIFVEVVTVVLREDAIITIN